MNIENLKRLELAQCFRVDPRTISRWVKDGMPRTESGRYCLPECFNWRLEQADRAAEAVPTAKTADNSEWLERYRKERALLARMERKKRQGELIERQEHDAILSMACVDLRNTMLSWASRMFPTDDESRQALRSEVIALLESFVRCKAFIDDRVEQKKAPKSKIKRNSRRKKNVVRDNRCHL